MADYSSIERPYDAVGNRSPGGTSPVLNDNTTLFNQPAAASSFSDPTSTGTQSLTGAGYSGMQTTMTPSGPVETQPVSTSSSMNNIWISTYIRSVNWKPNASGFNIDGSTGNAEFNNIVVRGTIYATSGTIGGFKISGSQLTSSKGSLVLDGIDESIELYDSNNILRIAMGSSNEGFNIFAPNGNPQFTLGGTLPGAQSGQLSAFGIFDASISKVPVATIGYYQDIKNSVVVTTGLNIASNNTLWLTSENATIQISTGGSGYVVLVSPIFSIHAQLIQPGADASSNLGAIGRRFVQGYFQNISVCSSSTIPSLQSSFAQIMSGTGSPAGGITATVGSIWLRTDGGSGTTLYVKESGTGTSGWVGK